MQAPHKDGMTHDERKRKVLAQGALYRLGVVEAREVVRENLSPELLARGALSRVAHFASSLVGGGKTMQSIKTLSSGGFNLRSLQSVTPLLMSGASFLARPALRKPLIYGGVIVTVGGLAYYLSRKRTPPVVVPIDEAR